MLKALDIQTRAILAIGRDRAALARQAEAAVGREGYCIRPVDPEPIGLFTSVDSGVHPTRLLDGRII